MVEFERPALKTLSLSTTMAPAARAAATLDWLVINRPERLRQFHAAMLRIIDELPMTAAESSWDLRV
jgi:hypothetical protein